MNVCLDSIKRSITKHTKGIIIIHYAGIAADIMKIVKLARKFNLIVIEDGPAIYSTFKK